MVTRCLKIKFETMGPPVPLLARLRNFSHLPKGVWSLGYCRLAFLTLSSSRLDPTPTSDACRTTLSSVGHRWYLGCPESGLRALVMFSDDQAAEHQFWIDLHVRVCCEMERPIFRRLGRFEGLIPKRYYLLDGVPRRITGVAWTMGARGSENWKFSLTLPFSTSWSDLSPAEANVVITPEKKEIEVELGQQ